MRKVVYIIIFLFLLVGCSTRKSQKEQVADVSLKEQLKDEKIELVHEDTVIAEIPSTEVVEPKLSVEKVSAISNKQINITYKGKDRTRIVKTTDIFKNIRYVPLETNDVSLLNPNPKRIICTKNYIYVKDTRSTGPEIFLYTLDGGFLHTIGKRGQGPEEFLTCLNMNVSDKGIVSFTDRSYSSIISYTTDDKFVSRIPIKTMPLYDLAYLNDSLLLLKSHYDHSGNKFHIVNVYNGKEIDSFYAIKNNAYTIYFPETMVKYKDKVLVAEYHNNEILEITKNGVNTRYIINVNDKMPPKGFWSKKVATYSEIRNEDQRMKYIGHIPCFSETESSIFLGFRGTLDDDDTQGWAFIDKSSGKHQTFKRIMLADNVVIEPNFFYSQSDGKVVFAVSPETILNSGNQEFISQFPNLKEDDNPILMFAELK